MSDQTYMLILRLLHIGFGVFWAGSALNFALFVIPALKSSGPEGTKFMQALGKTGYPLVMMISSIVSITAGILLISKLSGGFRSEWFGSTYAQVVTGGGLLAIIAFIIGITVNKPAATRIAKIGEAVAKQGSPPTADQIAQLTSSRKKIFSASKYIAVLLTIAVIAMSVFRYVS